MVAPFVTPSHLLSSNQSLKSVGVLVGGSQICGSQFQKKASGALTVKNLRLSPQANHKSSPTWFEADEALICQDLSSIKGTGRIRLCLGERTLEGESFTLLTEENVLLLSQVIMRSRDPMMRLSANRMRAKYHLDQTANDESGIPILETLELIGSVQGSIVLPWRGEGRKFDIQAGRIIFDQTQDKTHITVIGTRREPASLKSRDGLITLTCEHGVLSYDAEEIQFTGDVEGSGHLSGAAMFSPGERTQFHVTKASAFSITTSLEEPLWWAGDANHCSFDRMVIHNAHCGERQLGDVLVLQDPGFAQRLKDRKKS
ncbi:MAG: hypothetical protein P1V97_23610 [Planctomycetota bacterium]|nr:hypothetical protein [Planctomycetota bacterium]